MATTDLLQLIPIGQAARMLGCSVTWARKLGERGDLEVVDTPLGRLVSPESLEAYAARRSAEQLAKSA